MKKGASWTYDTPSFLMVISFEFIPFLPIPSAIG